MDWFKTSCITILKMVTRRGFWKAI